MYPWSRSFGHYLKLVVIGEFRNKDQPVHQELRLLAQLPLHHDGPVQSLHHCRCRTNTPVDLLLYFSLVNKTPRYLNSFTWGTISSLTRRRHSTFFGWEQWPLFSSWLLHIWQELEVTGRWSKQDQITCKNRPDPEVTKLDPLNTSLHKGARHPIIPENSPTGFPEVWSQMPSTDPQNTCGMVGQTIPHTLKNPAEGVVLVHCSTSRTKTTLLLLNLKIDYPADPHLQYPEEDLAREDLVPFLRRRMVIQNLFEAIRMSF